MQLPRPRTRTDGRRGRRIAPFLVAVAALAGCGTTAAAGPPVATIPAATAAKVVGPSPTRPCGVARRSRAIRHVVWIVMENRALTDVLGSPSAPYLDSLGRACGVATHDAGVSHPSLPNYIALTSGSTHGIGDDNGPSSHRVGGPSLFSLLGSHWRSLEDGMPTPCDRSDHGDYAVKHNPAAYYTALGATCRAQDVPLGAAPDLSASFTLITPNLCHDMHDCSTATGDRWLATEMPSILRTAAYRSGTTAVFITWDENDSGGSLVPTYVVAPAVRPGLAVATPFTHYSLLRTTEELLGLHPLLGGAAAARSMRGPFGL